MKVTISKSGKPHITGIVYSEEALSKAIEQIKNKTRLGEIYTEERRDYSTVSIIDAAFMYDNVRMENGSVVADITVLDTPKGKQLKELLNITPGRFSMCYTGKIDEDKNATGLIVSNCLWYHNKD